MYRTICLLISLLWIQISLLFANPPADSLKQAHLDSLRRVERTQTGLDRINTRIDIIKRHDLPDGGSYLLADSIFEEADELELYERAAEAQLTKGHIYFQFEEFDSAMVTYKKVYRYVLDHEVESKRFDAHGAIAGVFERWNIPDSAIHYSVMDAEYWKEADSTEYIWSLWRLSYYYDIYGRIYDKYDTEKEVLEIGEALQDSQTISSAYTQVACILGKLNDAESAKEYFDKAISINERHASPSNKIVALSNAAVFYKKQEEYQLADSLNRVALNIVNTEIKGQPDHDYRYKYFSSVIHINLSTLASVKEDWDSTLFHGRKSLSFSVQSKILSSQLMAASHIALASAKLGQVDSAQKYLSICEKEISRASNPKTYRYFLQANVAYAEALKDLEGALLYFKDYKALSDSLERANTDQRMQFLNKKFLADQKDREIEQLKFQAETEQTRRTNLIFLLILIVIIAGISLYFLATRAQQNRALLEKNQEVDKMKSRFFANISHELRTPLSLIQGPVESLLASADDEEKVMLQLVRKNSRQLKKLIDQVLELAKIEEGAYQLRASQQDLSPLLKVWAASFQSKAEQKEIQLNISLSESLIFFFQTDLIRQILNNLLSNAIKFTPEHGTVELTSQSSAETIILTITDNGPGIAAEHLPHIFDRFYQVNQADGSEATGTGIGLALTKELVELHGGMITVTSKPENGTCFTLTFQKGSRHLSSDQISHLPEQSVSPLPESEETETTPEVAAPTDSELPLVLIVEDHEDLRLYLSQELGKEVRILTAQNGEEGLAIAKKELPDLVVTDLMMPQLNGLDMTRSIKSDYLTDHIPVIMLTARGESEDLLQGLESRVDSYLSKPFNPIELRLRVENMIRLRKNIRKQEPLEGIQEVVPNYTVVEQRFLTSLHEVLDKELGNENLDVSRLAEGVHLSRSQLFRKLRTITGESPSSYMRKYRLRKAKELLESRQGTVTEVSYMVGFRSPSYFSKCFSDQYGKPPVHFTR